jgi:hypothetical protein
LCPGSGLAAGVNQRDDVAIQLQLGNDRLKMRDDVDLAPLDGRNRAGTAANTDETGIAGLQPGLGHGMDSREIGGGTRRRDADLQPLEISGGFHLVGNRLAHADDDGGKAQQLNRGADVLALGLHADGVLIGTSDKIDRAANQRLQRFGTTGKIIDFHIKAKILEMALPLGNRQRQVIQQRLAADAKAELGLLDSALRAGRLRQAGKAKGCSGTGKSQKMTTIHGVLLQMLLTRTLWPVGRQAVQGNGSGVGTQTVLVSPGFHTRSGFSTIVTMVSIIITKIIRMTIPANTPVTSNTPSA